jgi:DEAD/DEAH box helicase domain-containing protein
MRSGSYAVAKNKISFFGDGVYPDAIRIFTPFSKGIPLEKCKISPDLEPLLKIYEPKIATAGVFPHQASFFKSFSAAKNQNFIVTTATGSGKSLCFWAWVFEYLMRDPSATALLCFPTQALMWGQAERLARMSDSNTLSYPGSRDTTPYGGSIKAKGRPLGWTVWHGLGRGYARNTDMEVHEKSKAFELSRIRIATLDKAHWSLNQGKRNQDFLARLKCLVLDEAHVYDGVFGANVHYFLKRLWLSCDMLNHRNPNVFLASATLSRATAFAKTLLSLSDERDIIHVADSTKQEIDLVPTKDVPKSLQNPPVNGLLRIVLLLDGLKRETRLPPFMSSETLLGKDVNAIYFSQSKYESKILAMELGRKSSSREALIYDADLPPARRRALERTLNNPAVKGKTVVATSAMELGIDIEGLDVCFIDKVPPRRADMLQRIGRVGRRADRPGLVIMRLGAEPLDQFVLQDPPTAFRLDQTEYIPIPLHLEMLKWRCMLVRFLSG